MSEVPEINGKPAAKIHVHVEEKVGLPSYSNVSYGTSITRYVEDTEDGRAEGLVEATGEVEAWLSDYFRTNVQSMLEKGGRDS